MTQNLNESAGDRAYREEQHRIRAFIRQLEASPRAATGPRVYGLATDEIPIVVERLTTMIRETKNKGKKRRLRKYRSKLEKAL